MLDRTIRSGVAVTSVRLKVIIFLIVNTDEEADTSADVDEETDINVDEDIDIQYLNNYVEELVEYTVRRWRLCRST